jgi:hypothetical protein
MGNADWEQLCILFNRSMVNLVGNNAVPREWESLKTKFKSLRNTKKPTGDPDCPWEVKTAKRL